MSLEPTDNSRLIGHFPTIGQLRDVTRSNGVDTSISHATINNDYSRLLYPCKEKTEGRWPNCPFTLLVVQLDEGEKEAEEGGGFIVYANGEHCHERGEVVGKKQEIRLDSLAPGATVQEVITLDDDDNGGQQLENGVAGENNQPAGNSRPRRKQRVVRRRRRRRVPSGYSFHSSVDTREDVDRVRVLDEQGTRPGKGVERRIPFVCRRGKKPKRLVSGAVFTDCPRRMLAMLERDGSYSIYVIGEHNHPIDERPRRVFRYRQMAAQYLSDGGESLLTNTPSEPPPDLLTESWRLTHRLSDQHKFLGRMHEAECWAFLRLCGVIPNKITGLMMTQAKCYYSCRHMTKSGCPYKLYTIPVEGSEGKEFYIYEKDSHNEHTVKETASTKEESGVYLKSFPSWEKVNKFRLAKKLKKVNGYFPPNTGRVMYYCYTSGCNYSIRAAESTTLDGTMEIKLFELGEHQHKRRVAMDEPLPESVKKAKLEGSCNLEVNSSEWRTAYNIHQQFRYVSAMSQAEWKAHQKANRITRNGILSFGGMKGGYYCSINPYSGCQYRMVAVRDELDEDRVHVLEKGEHSDHVTINAPKGQKAKKEIPIGAGYTHFRSFTTIDEIRAFAQKSKTILMNSSFGGRKHQYNCTICHYLLAFIQHQENGPWEGYEKGKHLHPV